MRLLTQPSVYMRTSFWGGGLCRSRLFNLVKWSISYNSINRDSPHALCYNSIALNNFHKELPLSLELEHVQKLYRYFKSDVRPNIKRMVVSIRAVFQISLLRRDCV